MADVQPLHGFRFAQELVGDPAQTITPPFDVISPAAQTRYYERNPYNIIRLELGKTYPTDDAFNNNYARAATTLAEWRLEGVLRQEQTLCYYLYQQRFSYAGQSYIRTSLLARVRLEPWDAQVILPHEHTRTKDKEDRLQLLRACSTNFSPIMCMYDDPQGRIRRVLAHYAEQPEVHIQDEVGEEHLLQPITDAQQIALIQDFFAQRQLYIADGHHRYTTALNYRDEIAAQRGGLSSQDGANFVFMALIDVDDPGMLVLPTHRLLFDLTEEQLRQLNAEQLATNFTVKSLTEATDEAMQERLASANQQQPSFIIKTAETTLLLTINDHGQQLMKESGHSEAWNALDVAVVQKLLLESQLQITAEDVAAGHHIRYEHETQQALQALQTGAAQVVILLQGIPFRKVRDVALADDRMPQKSTYLYPKLITGLVINPLW
ncbi:DUF1015 domain-containing protein [Dictyobacter arantiisoli]|uniref:Phosphatase n=1 Tax=Dictyobacter arantiisoli TaxID=2014874 RepID=A0A5A5T840_9CHLR|nr:DUF1015 domain-containing protein [Dictyobacter arantiisoli]GCF07631.1 phosphatase [Dictyobacter arantiisoli]